MMHDRAMHRATAGLVAAALWLVTGCDGNDTGGAGAGGGATTSGAGGTGATGGGGATGTGGAGGGGNGGAGGGLCVPETAPAAMAPLALFFLVDRSGSMAGSNWDGVTQALSSFYSDPTWAGLEAALTYMPAPQANDQNICDPLVYQTPAVLPGPLPQNAPALTGSLASTSPTGSSTPLHGALQGALSVAVGYRAAHPAQSVAVVLIADGDPNGCPGNQNDILEIAQLAASALSFNGVRTYVYPVMGAPGLEPIAIAGGTGQPFASFDDLAAHGGACDFVLPPPPDPNQPIDPAMINVQIVLGGQGMPVLLPHAQDEQDCAGGPGWYYLPGSPPPGFRLCDASCEAVVAAPGTTTQAVFGCPTQEN